MNTIYFFYKIHHCMSLHGYDNFFFSSVAEIFFFERRLYNLSIFSVTIEFGFKEHETSRPRC